MNNSSYFDWVTNSLLYKDINEHIIKLIKEKSRDYMIDETKINELTQYKVRINKKLNKEEVKQIKDEIEKINYLPVTVRLDINNPEQVEKMQKLVKHLYNADRLVYIPSPSGGEYVPLSDGNRVFSSIQIDLSTLIDYTYLTNNPLCLYIFKKLDISSDLVKIVDNHYFISDHSLYGNIINELIEIQSTHFVTDSMTEADMHKYEELIFMNNSQLVEYLPNNRLVVKSILPSDWFRSAIIRISIGKLPLYNFWNSFEVTMKYEPSAQAKLTYACYRAYIDMIKIYPLLIHYIDQINVSDVLDVTAPFHTYEASEIFRTNVSGYLRKADKWVVSSYENKTDAIYYRWYVKKLYPYLVPLFFPLNNGFYVVINETLIMDDMTKKAKDELRAELQIFLKRKCNDLYEITKINELLHTIPINNICLSKKDVDFIKKLSIRDLQTEYPVSLLNIPVNDNLIRKIKMQDLILQGVFSFGPIDGILDYNDKILYVSPLDKNATITCKKDNVFLWKLYEHYDMVWLIKDAKNVRNINKLVQKLWESGWFLSHWCQAYITSRGEMSIVPIRRNLFLTYLGYYPEQLEQYLSLNI